MRKRDKKRNPVQLREPQPLDPKEPYSDSAH
jgi:hypothetical protein